MTLLLVRLTSLTFNKPLITNICIVWMTCGVGHCSSILPSVAPTLFFGHYAQRAAVNTVDDHPQGFMQGKEYQRLVLVQH